MYSLHYTAKERAPKSEEDLKEVVQNPDYRLVLDRMGIDPANFDEMLVSERNGEPLIIFYGVRFKLESGKGNPLAIEATGVAGVRMVIYTDNTIKEIEGEDAFQELVAKGEKIGSKEAGKSAKSDNES